jgi:CTP:molybdopterin cytidylyltransferase MocA
MTIAAVLIATETLDGVPVALLPFDGDSTLVEYQVAQLRAAGVDAVEVVLGAAADRIIALITADNVEPVVSRTPDDDAASLRAGAAAVPRDARAALVLRISEPRPAPLLRSLLEAHERGGGPMTLPSFEGTAGRPAVLGRDALAAARNVTAAGDALGALIKARGPAHEAPFDTDVVLLRIASTRDCAAARRAFGLM